MQKVEFTVKHNDIIYECYIDEDGYVWYLNERGNPATGTRQGKAKDIDEAKEIALQSLLEHGH
jgi:hypothetical protein